MNVNFTIIGGRLTRDIDVKYLPTGIAVIQFSIANNQVWIKDGQKKENASFINLKAFGKTAENIAQYFKKGYPILVEGRVQTDQWEKDGQKRSMTYIIVSRFHFVGSKQDKRENQSGNDNIYWDNEEE